MSNLSSSSSDNSAREATCVSLCAAPRPESGRGSTHVRDARGHELGLVLRQIQFLQQARERQRLLGAAAAADATPKNTTRRRPAVVAARNVEHVKHWYLCQRWRAVRWCACAASERMGRDRCDALRGAEAARLLRGAWMLPQILPSQVCERPAPARRPRESSTRGAGPGPLPGAVVGNPVRARGLS